MADHAPPARVALVVGCLGQGGAEKQLTYMVRSLAAAEVDVRAYSLTLGEFYERELSSHAPVTWIGRQSAPPLRLAELTRLLLAYRPHVVQSSHFFANLYVVPMGPLIGAVTVGSIRNDVHHELESYPGWGRWLLRLPPALLANSQAALRNAERLGVDPGRLRVIQNVIDVESFAARVAAARPSAAPGTQIIAACVARLVKAKRLDRFLRALAIARETAPYIAGLIVGDGPERHDLEVLAQSLGLLPSGVSFLGQQDDVAPYLARADILVLSSDHEGFPNVILEAMSASLPVVTTPAGDAPTVVEEGKTGFVVSMDERLLASRLTTLAGSTALRRDMGLRGHARVLRHYNYPSLGPRLLDLYFDLAQHQRRERAIRALVGLV